MKVWLHRLSKDIIDVFGGGKTSKGMRDLRLTVERGEKLGPYTFDELVAMGEGKHELDFKDGD